VRYRDETKIKKIAVKPTPSDALLLPAEATARGQYCFSIVDKFLSVNTITREPLYSPL